MAEKVQPDSTMFFNGAKQFLCVNADCGNPVAKQDDACSDACYEAVYG